MKTLAAMDMKTTMGKFRRWTLELLTHPGWLILSHSVPLAITTCCWWSHCSTLLAQQPWCIADYENSWTDEWPDSLTSCVRRTGGAGHRASARLGCCCCCGRSWGARRVSLGVERQLRTTRRGLGLLTLQSHICGSGKLDGRCLCCWWGVELKYFICEGIGSSQSEREFRNLAAQQFPENRGATMIIEF